MIDSLQIELLPSDKSIKGWQQGLDGITYFIEYQKDGHYSFKNYWTPISQNTLKEAMQLQNFISGLAIILDLEKNSQDFQQDIPFDHWSYPGSPTTVFRVKPRPKKRKDG